ncbi:MAG: TetR family transcriptional regulator [Pseudomonadales bacterium]
MGLREQQRAALRARILEVCGRLFREHGFDPTTVTRIAREAGISRQTFFNHFASKEAVLTQLGLAWLREQAAVPRLRTGRKRTESILAGTRRAVLAQMRAIAADAEFMRLVFTRSGVLFPQSASPDGRLAADQARPLFDNIALVMQAARDRGEIRADIEPLQVAELYVSTMLMTARLWLVDYWRDGVALETRAARALDVLEAGLATAPDARETGSARDGGD